MLSLKTFAAIKALAFQQSPGLGSGRLAEILAAGFGFTTYASMRAALKSAEMNVEFNLAAAARRAAEFGISPLPDGFPFWSNNVPVTLSPRKLRTIIERAVAREAAEKEIWSDARRRFGLGDVWSLADPGVSEGLEKSHDSPARELLLEELSDLSAEHIRELIAVMYIGRGDAFDTASPISECWDYAFHVARVSENPVAAVNYLMGKAPLARYLRDGATRLGIAA